SMFLHLLYSSRFPPREHIFPDSTLFRPLDESMGGAGLLRPRAPSARRRANHSPRVWRQAPHVARGIATTAGEWFARRRADGAREIGRAHVELQSRGHLVCRLLLEKKKKE